MLAIIFIPTRPLISNPATLSSLNLSCREMHLNIITDYSLYLMQLN